MIRNETTLDIPYSEEEKEELSHCELCPRKCGVDRLNGERGYCKCGAGIEVSAVCNHKGEEPVIVGKKGICNVFFAHCNLQCVYCQNNQISCNGTAVKSPFTSFDSLIQKIECVLSESENIIGFVSPTHQLPLMKAVIRTLHQKGLHPRTVYNTNAYDSCGQLRKLEGLVDVYLPDYKYADKLLARQLSQAPDYPARALDAIAEMYRQKGCSLLTDKDERIESGLIVRHLVLPSQEENSKRVLEALSDISLNLNVSLMSQYTPMGLMEQDYLNRRLTRQEYERVTDYFYGLGLHKGFFQDLSSQGCLVPDFDKGTWSGE